MDTLIETFAGHEAFVPLTIIFGFAFLIVLTVIIAGTIDSIVKGRSRERSRREVAAYIAEGSMTPEEGERILSASLKTGSDSA